MFKILKLGHGDTIHDPCIFMGLSFPLPTIFQKYNSKKNLKSKTINIENMKKYFGADFDVNCIQSENDIEHYEMEF